MKSRLKIALVDRVNDRGFSTVVALGIGLSLTLIGLMMVTRSQGDVSTVSSQRAMAKSLAAAETGIVRFQTLIDRNREIAVYPTCGDSSLSNTSPCSDTTNPSWFNSAAISASTTIAPAVSAAATRNWQNIDPTNPSKGQYRLIDYTYDSVLKSASLTIEGRVEQDVGRGPSTTRLEIAIPITSSATAAGIPGLWAQNFALSNNAAEIAANVLDSSEVIGGNSFIPTYNSFLRNLPITPILSTKPYPLSSTPPTATKKNLPFPPLPGNTYPGQLASFPAAHINAKTCISSSNATSFTFPQNGDIFTDASGATNVGTYNSSDLATDPSGVGTYIYRLDASCGGKSISFSNSGGLQLGTTTNQTIILFLDGDLTTSGNGGVRGYTDGTNESTVFIYSNGNIKISNGGSITTPEKLQIYNYGINQIALTNTGDIRGFIFAPESEIKLTNTGSIIGAAWVQRFRSSNKGGVYQEIFDASKLKVSATTELTNKMGGISSWSQKPIN